MSTWEFFEALCYLEHNQSTRNQMNFYQEKDDKLLSTLPQVYFMEEQNFKKIKKNKINFIMRESWGKFKK